MTVVLVPGKSYRIKFRRYLENGHRVVEQNVQVLEINRYGEAILNLRPWGEGGTANLKVENILEANEIPRGPLGR